MSAARILLVLSLLAALAPFVVGKTALTLEAHDSYFVLAGSEEKNPTLLVPPGFVTLTLVQAGVQPHNWIVDGLEGARAPASGALAAGETATAQFEVAEDAAYTYYCSIHPPTMRGVLTAREGATPPARDTPAPAWPAALAVLGVAAAFARRA